MVNKLVAFIASILIVLPMAIALAAPSRPAGGLGKERGGLRVSIQGEETYAAGAPVFVKLALKNFGDEAIEIDGQLTLFAVEVSWPVPSREGCTGRYSGTRTRTLQFAQTHRGQHVPRPTTLAPGATREVEVDLASWAAASVNGSTPLGAGVFKAVARSVGGIKSLPLGFTIEGKPGKGRCPRNPGWGHWGR